MFLEVEEGGQDLEEGGQDLDEEAVKVYNQIKVASVMNS